MLNRRQILSLPLLAALPLSASPQRGDGCPFPNGSRWVAAHTFLLEAGDLWVFKGSTVDFDGEGWVYFPGNVRVPVESVSELQRKGWIQPADWLAHQKAGHKCRFFLAKDPVDPFAQLTPDQQDRAYLARQLSYHVQLNKRLYHSGIQPGYRLTIQAVDTNRQPFGPRSVRDTVAYRSGHLPLCWLDVPHLEVDESKRLGGFWIASERLDEPPYPYHNPTPMERLVALLERKATYDRVFQTRASQGWAYTTV